jgi:hypothetical protein
MRVCAACSTENDDTRVVCLNCGQRLPEPVKGTALRVPSAGASAPSVNVFKKAAPGVLRTAKRRSVVPNLFFFVFLPALGFAVWLAIQPLKDIPATPAPDGAADNALAAYLRDAAASNPGAWSTNESAVNRFLAANIKLQPVQNSLGINASFERAFVRFGNGSADFTMQLRLFDRDLFFRLRLAPEKTADGLALRPVGAWIGDLPIYPALAPLVMPVFQPCAVALMDVFDITSTASSAEISPSKIVVKWSAGASR